MLPVSVLYNYNIKCDVIKYIIKVGDKMSKSITFSVGEKLGEGGYGKVFKCTSSEMSDKQLAVKVIKLNSSGVGCVLEASIMMTYTHPNINSSLVTTYTSGYIYIIQEEAKCDLCKIIETVTPTRDLLLNYYHQIIEGVCVLHKEGLIHCDIKPSNILVYDDGLLKLTDFTLSVLNIDNIKYERVTGGTLCFCAPEILSGNLWDMSVDIWSLGCTFYQMATKVQLVPKQQQEDCVKRTYESILEWKFYLQEIDEFNPTVTYNPIRVSIVYNEIDLDIREFIDSMLLYDPDIRPNIHAIRNSLLFYGMYKESCLINSPSVRSVSVGRKIEHYINSLTSNIRVIDMSKELCSRIQSKLKLDLVKIETCVWISTKIITGYVPKKLKAPLDYIIKEEIIILTTLGFRVHTIVQ